MFSRRVVLWRQIHRACHHQERAFSVSISRQQNATGKLVYPAAPSSQHCDLTSFLSYAKRTGLDEKSTVFVGTRYEYAAAETLAQYGFSLQRIGGASDYGTDLIGTWDIHPKTSGQPQTIKVLMQCKAGASQRAGPQHIRELEGAIVGAPAGWRAIGQNKVMAFLISERPATKGVQQALSRSRWPMGYIFYEGETGELRQMLWNSLASDLALESIEVGTRYIGEKTKLILTRQGKKIEFWDDARKKIDIVVKVPRASVRDPGRSVHISGHILERGFRVDNGKSYFQHSNIAAH